MRPRMEASGKEGNGGAGGGQARPHEKDLARGAHGEPLFGGGGYPETSAAGFSHGKRERYFRRARDGRDGKRAGISAGTMAMYDPFFRDRREAALLQLLFA